MEAISNSEPATGQMILESYAAFLDNEKEAILSKSSQFEQKIKSHFEGIKDSIQKLTELIVNKTINHI